MNLADVLIVVLLLSSLLRGYELGFTRQLFSTLGFFLGLWLGTRLEPITVSMAHTQTSRSLVTLITTLGCAFLVLSAAEYVGIYLKNKFNVRRFNYIDDGLGSTLAFVSVLAAVWLSASILISLPSPGLQQTIKDSRIISLLDDHLPAAPTIIADLGHLIDPNGFPEVFSGTEPAPSSTVKLPALGDLKAAVDADRASVVKIEGQGCGEIVEGSGFVIGNGLVATNAHVIAGIRQPYVLDANGTHTASAVLFDPNLDLAVLRTSHLAGRPLPFAAANAANSSAAAVLGYPGGGSFSAKPAAVLDTFTAVGRNIYNQGNVEREVYELRADVIPGNSGGPLVAQDGNVVGVIFAESTSYSHVGYALTLNAIKADIAKAQANSSRVATGSCASD